MTPRSFLAGALAAVLIAGCRPDRDWHRRGERPATPEAAIDPPVRPEQAALKALQDTSGLPHMPSGEKVQDVTLTKEQAVAAARVRRCTFFWPRYWPRNLPPPRIQATSRLWAESVGTTRTA